MITLAGSTGYTLRATRDPEDITAAQRLRYEVFNLELGEGLSSSYRTGLDADPFDTQCDHLIVEDRVNGNIVGTYRLQSGRMAGEGRGYYSATEFDFTPFEPLRGSILELGRACIHQQHRKRSVLDLLWRGIAGYALQGDFRYLLGCSSLNSQDPKEGWGLYHQLKDQHLADPALRTNPTDGFVLPVPEEIPENRVAPKLFSAYLSVGAVIAGPPALDREFGTIDFLTILDVQGMTPSGRKHFFRGHA